ncbi:Uncharacterized conserved protein [Oceanospirillum multiglobuliferum]|uniref:DUF2132 domain-containing protein n=1 Tax=Oceanospirillum multiglobuliferum TaxID=64969 RepID=A0A1T4KVI3_9GAMM|nr:hypothetical protein BTE48_11530 [Oceanospirillum multiglobuliferum]SJZ46373.1 Uncharacterized conserved protein [Oceanospirillum multiglobuliferum]
MNQPSAKPISKSDPLHGVKLEAILTELVEHYGWAQLAEQIAINCFKSDPTIKSSLKFLRKTPWARQQVETLYLKMKGASARKRATKTTRALEAEKARATLSLSKNTSQAAAAQKGQNNRSNGSVSKRNTGQTKGTQPAVNPWLKAKAKNTEE